MAEIKSLAKDTAIYGVSSILGKILNWLLTPLFTYTLATTGEYGIVTNLYAYVAMAIVILTFGMETGLFRFANRQDEYHPTVVYSTTLISVGSVVLLFLILASALIQPLTNWIAAGEIPVVYVFMMVLVLCMDAFSCIPFAYLRYKQRPVRFAALKMLYIVLYIALCFFLLVGCPKLYESHPHWISWFYKPDFQVGYILLSNLIATFIQTCFLLPELTGFKYKFDRPLFIKMLKYSFPLLILGVAGMMNQTIDKIIFPKMYTGEANPFDELGIYGACFKIGVIMVMFTQAFRYAYEPFIFSKNTGANNKKAYSDAMKYFILLGLLIFLGVVFYIDMLKYFFPSTYYEGLPVVPIVLLGELFFGIYFNLSIWYKLTDQTHWGATLSIIGCVVTVLINILFIPAYGYMACAWASFVANLLIVLLSYFLGQKKYPVDYDLKTIGLYVGLALVLYLLAVCIPIDNQWIRLGFRTILISIYISVLIKRDIPLKGIPYINRFFR